MRLVMVALLPILHGYHTLQLYRMVGGSKRWAYSIVWEICGNTLVGEADFHHFRQLRWLRKWNSKTQSYYVFRVEANRGCKPKSVSFYLAREILGLQAGSAEEADHRNHD